MQIKGKFIRLSGLFVCIPLAVSLFSCGGNRQKAIENSQILYRMAIDLDNKGESTQALSQALKAEKLNPRDAEIQNLLGLFFQRNKMYDRSEQKFLKAINIDPEYSEAKTNLSALYIEMNQFDKAIEYGLKAVENITYVSPERAYNNVAYAYYQKGDSQNAQAYYTKALLHNKDFFQPHWGLAKIYYDKGKYPDAKKEYETSIAVCKECTPLYYELGITLLKMKDRKGATKAFEDCKNASKGDEFGEKCAGKLSALGK